MSLSIPILVAEDNDFVRLQVVKILQDAGYTLVEATDGDQAIERVKTSAISLAIVDVRMEPLDGFDFIKALRGMEMKNPVILVTGDDNPDILQHAAELGVAAVLIKPVQKDRLLKAVERAAQMFNRMEASV